MKYSHETDNIIPVEASRLIAFLQDTKEFYSLGSFSEIKEVGDGKWKLVEHINFLKMNVTYDAVQEPLPNGVKSLINASLGVVVNSLWTVEDVPGQPGHCRAKEVASIEAPITHFHFVKGQFIESHNKLPELFKERFAKEDAAK